MKITKNTEIVIGTLVVLPSGEVCVVRAVCHEPDGKCYKVQYLEEDGEDYIPVGDERVVWHYELVGGEV